MNVQLPKIKEVVPNLEEISRWKPEYIGKPIKILYDEVFSKDFRDAVAHFALDSAKPLVISNYITSARFSSEIYPIERCCRVLVYSEEQTIKTISETQY